MMKTRKKKSGILKAVGACLMVLLIATAAYGANNTWEGSGPFATGLGNRVISVIAVDPAHPNIMYAGTGSGTVFRYSATWQVSAGTDLNGSIDTQYSAPSQTINQGSSAGFRFLANEGYYISAISGCGLNYMPPSGEGLSVYTATTAPAYRDCTASASFLSVAGQFVVRRSYASGGPYEYGNVIMNAYNNPANNATAFGIELTSAGIFGGDNNLLFDQNYVIKLKGGLNPDFSSGVAGPSIIHGSLTLTSGAATVENVGIGSPQP